MSEHVLVWEFRVRAGCEAEFEATYAADGAWARLFARDPGFRGTELLRDPAIPGRYLTIDRWAGPGDFARFRAAHGEDYAALDAQCEPWTESEIRLGAFAAHSSDGSS